MAANSERGYLWFWMTRSLFCGFCVFAFVMVLWPVYATGSAQNRQALSHIKELGLGCAMYANEYDERLPSASKWMDELVPYTKDKTLFNASDRDHKIDGYGFAFRRKLSDRETKKVANPNKVALLFDSLNLTWNANGGLELLPFPGRREGKNVIGFADGHARKCVPGSSFFK